MRKWSWIVGAIVVILIGVAIWVYQSGFLITSKTDIAIHQSWKLVRACEAYRVKNRTDGKYPARLLDVAVPSDGKPATIDGGEAAIRDPWGDEFKYAVVESKDGPAPYVWFEREIDGRRHLIGAKMVAGQFQPFGISGH